LFIWGTEAISDCRFQIADCERKKMNIEYRTQNRECRSQRGSAIILAIVLTTLLAIIGVLFLISSRVDSIATSSIADNKDLTFAVDSVIAQISRDLTADIIMSGDPNYYADYPDTSNFWLASLEPNDVNMWPHITDLYNQLGVYAYLPVDKVLYEHGDTAGNSMPGNLYRADADGDGIPDSVWVQIQGVNSSKGKPIFAAVRIIDNAAMLNVNTGLKFDSAASVGATQMDINLMALAGKPGSPADALSESNLSLARNPSGSDYEKSVIWQYSDPCYSPCTPFDISDELEMRYRFLIDQQNTHTRIESWSKELAYPTGFLVSPQPYDSSSGHGKSEWIDATDYNLAQTTPSYSYRHIATTYNCDRIITPTGNKMVNINTAEPNEIRDAIRQGLIDANAAGDINGVAAQIAANVVDYRDNDSIVTKVNDYSGNPHFGFERPCVYISEVAASFARDSSDNPHRSYAIELYIPYYGIDTIDPNEKWSIQAGFSTPIELTGLNTNKYHIITNIDAFNPSSLTFNHAEATEDDTSINFSVSDTICLWRNINGVYNIPVDEVVVPVSFIEPVSGDMTKYVYSIQRDITLHKCIRRLWHIAADSNLGNFKSFDDSNDYIQAHPTNKPFTNVGELGQLFYNSAYVYGGTGPAMGVTEPGLRIDLRDPQYQQIFKYLTVWPPPFVDANETRIKGRININTAPWFVIAQLPWVSYQNYDIARTIVNKREMRGGYKSIGELMADANNSVDNIGYYGGIPFGSIPSPSVFMTPNDPNDFPNEDVFERRDLIFSRISNLVTVRSDVFTAYILVRIGQNGPQKRVIAILDRTWVVPDPTSPSGYAGKVKIVAIQNVPDPR
jgi:DNA uptake protein ComE-like DNA-binding protein